MSEFNSTDFLDGGKRQTVVHNHAPNQGGKNFLYGVAGLVLAATAIDQGMNGPDSQLNQLLHGGKPDTTVNNITVNTPAPRVKDALTKEDVKKILTDMQASAKDTTAVLTGVPQAPAQDSAMQLIKQNMQERDSILAAQSSPKPLFIIPEQ